MPLASSTHSGFPVSTFISSVSSDYRLCHSTPATTPELPPPDEKFLHPPRPAAVHSRLPVHFCYRDSFSFPLTRFFVTRTFRSAAAFPHSFCTHCNVVVPFLLSVPLFDFLPCYCRQPRPPRLQTVLECSSSTVPYSADVASSNLSNVDMEAPFEPRYMFSFLPISCSFVDACFQLSSRRQICSNRFIQDSHSSRLDPLPQQKATLPPSRTKMQRAHAAFPSSASLTPSRCSLVDEGAAFLMEPAALQVRS